MQWIELFSQGTGTYRSASCFSQYCDEEVTSPAPFFCMSTQVTEYLYLDSLPASLARHLSITVLDHCSVFSSLYCTSFSPGFACNVSLIAAMRRRVLLGGIVEVWGGGRQKQAQYKEWEKEKKTVKEQRGQTILGCIEGKRMASSCGNQRPVGVHVHSLMIRSKSSTSTVSSIMYYVCNRLYSKKLESVVFLFLLAKFPFVDRRHRQSNRELTLQEKDWSWMEEYGMLQYTSTTCKSIN